MAAAVYCVRERVTCISRGDVCVSASNPTPALLLVFFVAPKDVKDRLYFSQIILATPASWVMLFFGFVPFFSHQGARNTTAVDGLSWHGACRDNDIAALDRYGLS